MKITESELNEKIAELRGEVKHGQLQPGGSIVICEETKIVPAYSSDMNLAVELLRDLPFGELGQGWRSPEKADAIFVAYAPDGASLPILV